MRISEASLLGNMRAFASRRAGLAKRYETDWTKLCGQKAQIVRSALPLFASAASPEAYRLLLASTLISAGIEVVSIAIELHNHEHSGYSAGNRYPGGLQANHHDFYIKAKVDEKSAGNHFTGRFYWLHIEGNDPDSVLVTNVFNPLFGEAFEQAATTWFLKR